MSASDELRTDFLSSARGEQFTGCALILAWGLVASGEGQP